MGSNKPKTPPDSIKPMLRIVAVHRSVTERLNEWSEDLTWSTRAARFQAILNALKAGKLQEADLLLKTMVRSQIHNSDGVVEYGKRQRGGAPRLFVISRFASYFFVAAGLEEGSTGCPEIEVARSRGTQLSKLEAQPSVEAYKKALGRDYDVWPVPTVGTRETR